MAASLHLGAAVADCDSIEYHMLHQWLWERLPPPARSRRGRATSGRPTAPASG